MKPTKTRDETLAELATRSSEGSGAAKRFTSLLKRVIRVPKETIDARGKDWKALTLRLAKGRTWLKSQRKFRNKARLIRSVIYIITLTRDIRHS